jgi:hypothetical protein
MANDRSCENQRFPGDREGQNAHAERRTLVRLRAGKVHPSVRAEPVEALFFSCADGKEEGQAFDKLRPNGLGVHPDPRGDQPRISGA